MIHSFIHSFIRLLCFVSFVCITIPLGAQTISAEEKADTIEMPRRAVGLLSTETILVQNALKLIPQDTLAYVAIHGDNSNFKIFQANTWKTITHRSLARWIAEDTLYNGKTIVLLSCSNDSSSQNLANSLFRLDKAAKRTARKVIYTT